MWSAADLWYAESIAENAYELGQLIAKNNYTLVYGAEKDTDSLSTAAARGAKSVWWLTVGITYGKTPDIWWNMRSLTDVLICTWMERWWGREYILVSSCDAIISLGWWSGTLNEITIAYQKKIPIVCIKNTWWWSDRLADTYLDARGENDPARYICKWVSSPEEAISYLLQLS